MMDDIDDPARAALFRRAAGKYDPPGMTLRDYFAAAVLQGTSANTNADAYFAERDITFKDGAARLASGCYAIADAMLKERAK